MFRWSVPKPVFEFSIANDDSRSGRLDTETMTITTNDGCKYKGAHYWEGKAPMTLYTKEQLQGLDFAHITYPAKDDCYDIMYMRLVVGEGDNARCVWFKLVNA